MLNVRSGRRGRPHLEFQGRSSAVCVSVCVRDRQKERERECIGCVTEVSSTERIKTLN